MTTLPIEGRRRSAVAARCCACIAIALAVLGGGTPAAAQAPDIAVEHVTVIDVRSGARLRNQTILIAGNRIAEVGAAALVPVPGTSRRIDGRGTFAIPGLWDMHVHTFRSPGAALALHVANGITGIRDMGARAALPAVLALRDSIRAGKRSGPRMVVGGLVAGSNSPATVGTVVDSLLGLKVDFVKVSDVSPAIFRATGAAVRARGARWAGHVPITVDLREALDAGLGSHEHLVGMQPACAVSPDSLRERLGELTRQLQELPNLRAEAQLVDVLAARRDGAACDALIRDFARHGTAATPTLAVYRQLGWPGEMADTADPRLRFVPPEERARWLEFRTRPPWTADMPEQRALFELHADLLRRMARGGVLLLAGSDAGFGFLYHGFSLHDELASLVTAGLTPLQALQAATLNPARYLGAADSLGAIERGKVADLLLLEADPLSNIRNTARIHTVIVNGLVLDRTALDQLLEEAARRASTR